MNQEEIIIRGQEIEHTKQLGFIDGVIVTRACYDAILRKKLDGFKDPDGHSILGSINDDVTDQLDNGIIPNYYEARELEILASLKLRKIETTIKA